MYVCTYTLYVFILMPSAALYLYNFNIHRGVYKDLKAYIYMYVCMYGFVSDDCLLLPLSLVDRTLRTGL